MTELITIAIDGPAASGKGTIARRVAEHWNIRHLDTGLLYRAVATSALTNAVELDDEHACSEIASQLAPQDLESEALRSAEAGRGASVVAAHAKVRHALLEWQRDFAAEPPGAVLDGRDIGTVVLPNATVKLFVTADVDVRAARRWRELSESADIAYRTVLADLQERDHRDANRADAPMRQANDAALLDTSEMSVTGAVETAIALISEQIEAAKS